MSTTALPIRNDLHTLEAIEQRRVRIRLSLAAYAYEVEDKPTMSDGKFDALGRRVDTSIDTGCPELDWFFAEEFDPSTGNWIHKHPELDKVRDLFHRLRYDPENPYDI